MEDLLIVGAGGTSREIADAVEAINAVERRWNLLGFLDDDAALHGKVFEDHPVVGSLGEVARYPSCRFVVGIANHRTPGVRRDVVYRLGLAPERFATIVHPLAAVSPSSSLGVGSVVLSHAVVSHAVTIGRHVVVSALVSISHDVVVSDYATFAAAALVSGFSHVGIGAYLGAGCRILERRTIGEGAVVGIGAVALTDVPAHTTCFGVPARVIRVRRQPAA